MALDPRICAHRGHHVRHPENTLAAIASAVELGCRQIEIDVRRTRDDVWIVHHDPSLNRIHGVDLEIAALDAAEILRVPDVASLDDVLGAVPDDVRLFVENKELATSKRGNRTFIDALEIRHRRGGLITAITHGERWESRIAETELDHFVFETSWARAVERAEGDFDGFDLDVSGGRATPEARRNLMEKLRERGKRVVVWTVNDVDAARDWLEAGVDGVITDRPAAFLEESANS